jgi:hypothetical protein
MAPPITRTAWIDDDGTGTTGTILNNAEKQLLYNQIDAAILPSVATFTPVDVSGAGITFGVGTGGTWAQYGRLVWVWVQLLYPFSLTDGNAAWVGGFPRVIRSTGGGAIGFGPTVNIYLTNGNNATQFTDPATGNLLTNAAMSGRNFTFSACYLTD